MPVSLESGVGGEITLIDNENNATTFTYVDSTGGWRRTTTYPDSKTESHLYDREGRLRRFVDGRGYQTVYLYDSLSRLVGIDYLTSAGATAATSLALSYDNLGRLTKASQGTTTVDSTTYDNLGRTLTSLQTVAGTVYTLGYAYADASRTRTITLPDGATVKQKWTARGLLDSLWSGSRLLARFGYSSGLETSRTLGNGISLAQGFDAGGRLTSMAYSLAGQTLPNLGFAFDPSGNKNLIRRNHSTATSEAIGYTNDNQVSAWNKGTADASGAIASPTTSQSWTLDSRGNWSSWTQSGTAQTRTHSTANELTAMGATALTWDAAGNLTSDGTLAYVFGARGTLDTVKQGATVSGIYGADPLGRRALKTVGSLKTISVWDGWSCVWQKVTGSGTDTTKAFTYGNSIDREVSMIRKWGSSSDTVYVLQGANENTEALTDRTGAVVERYEYTPYGKPTVYTGAGTDGKWFTSDDVTSTASAKGNNALFQGRELDAETGNMYFRARYYQPTLGRFVSRDPMRLDGDPKNSFRFEWNRPSERDPFGGRSSGGDGPIMGSPCDNYPTSNTPCKRSCSECEGSSMSFGDTYAVRAKSICKVFLEMYRGGPSKGGLLINFSVRQAATMLASSENRCSQLSNCQDRNACRFDAHVASYLASGFFIPFVDNVAINTALGDWKGALPPGGYELGMHELWPDWMASKTGKSRTVKCRGGQ